MSELPLGWSWTTLGDIGLYLNGRGFKKSEWSESGRPIIRIQNLTGSGNHFNYFRGDPEDRYTARDGDLLVSWAATLGVYVWRGPEAVINQHIFKVQSRVDPRFHRYLLLAVLDDLRRQTHGSGMVHITKSKFESTPVPLPPLNEQRRIVAVIEEHFSRLDQAEHLLARTSLRVRAYREAILDKAFRAMDEPRRIADIAALSDGPFGSDLKTSHYVGEGPRVIRLQNIGRGFFRDERAHVTQEHYLRLEKHAALAGDIVAASLGEDAPRACLVPNWLGPAIVKADCIRIRPSADLDSRYLMWALNSRPIREQAATRIKGIGRPRLGLGGLRELRVPVPSLEQQVQVVEAIETSLSMADVLSAGVATASRRSAALRRSILERAFRGELVPQDPSDEPATALLERIAAERAAAETDSGGRPRRRATIQKS